MITKATIAPIKRSLLTILSSRIAYHGLFWFSMLLLFMLIAGTKNGFAFSLTNQIINLLFFAIVVYVNILFLIPKYLSQKKFFTYFVLLFAMAILITPIKLFIFHFKWEPYPILQNELFVDQDRYYIMSVFVAGSSTILKIIGDWLRHEREKQDLEKQNIQSELKFLKSQINPHFLFNTLNSIYALALKKSDNAPEMVIKLSEMLRYMLYECNEKKVTLEKEINYIKNYLSLERIRHDGKLSIQFNVLGDPKGLLVSPLMFVPFLENAFKHGASHHLNKGFIESRLEIVDNDINFYIENSKPSSMPEINHKIKSGGIGLKNVKRRLNIIYPSKHDLVINEKPNSYEVNLKLNL